MWRQERFYYELVRAHPTDFLISHPVSAVNYGFLYSLITQFLSRLACGATFAAGQRLVQTFFKLIIQFLICWFFTTTRGQWPKSCDQHQPAASAESFLSRFLPVDDSVRGQLVFEARAAALGMQDAFPAILVYITQNLPHSSLLLFCYSWVQSAVGHLAEEPASFENRSSLKKSVARSFLFATDTQLARKRLSDGANKNFIAVRIFIL